MKRLIDLILPVPVAVTAPTQPAMPPVSSASRSAYRVFRAPGPSWVNPGRHKRNLWVVHCRECEAKFFCATWEVAILAVHVLEDEHWQHRAAALGNPLAPDVVTRVQHWYTGDWIATFAEWQESERLLSEARAREAHR